MLIIKHSCVLYIQTSNEKNDSWMIRKSDFMVFFDENTIQMDKQPSPMVPYLTEFYRYLPLQTIFSSATFMSVTP